MVRRAVRGAGRQVAPRRCGPRTAPGRSSSARRRGHAAARARPPARAHGAALGDRTRAPEAHRELRVHLRPHGLRKLHGLPGGTGSRLPMPGYHVSARPRTCRIFAPLYPHAIVAR
ncbi:jg25368 [Pararge aegeria aegeria]|uniref:Jg25368 protein n=1 Tax=Pararge aegeria aegeria TaxID=348720 RepID=A0A8S4S902_9NEOP|nr:jg25368 [Pararge aegeria aegeria]